MDFVTELTIGSKLGSGGFGSVFQANHKVHGDVALKLLSQRPGESVAEWATRSGALLAEGQRLKAASHDHVVKVWDVVRNDANGLLHLIIELCDGGSLEAEYQKGPLALRTVRKILTEISRGLAHIHSRGMVHRDIKPGNILQHGKIYKIGDFGLVTDKMILNYASAQGYLDHLAPEVHGRAVTSVRTDIWAFGMTAYRLLHGATFYQENLPQAPGEIPKLVMKGGFARHLPWLPHIPEAWRRFLRCALHDDAHRRHTSCHEMAQALASLPIEPAWDCHFAPGQARWLLKEPAGRQVQVAWRAHSPRKHKWWAERLGGGKRTMVIGGKPGETVSPSDARAGLEAFFIKMAP